MPANNDTLVRAVLAIAATKTTNPTPEEWLVSELSRVTTAMLAGAPTIKSLSFEGASASGESEMRTDILVEVLTMALEEYRGDSTSAGMTLIPRFADFDLNSC